MRNAFDVFMLVGCVLFIAWLLFRGDEAAVKLCQEHHSAAVCLRTLAP